MKKNNHLLDWKIKEMEQFEMIQKKFDVKDMESFHVLLKYNIND